MTTFLLALAISAMSISDDSNRFSGECGLCFDSEILDVCEIGQGITFIDEGITRAEIDAEFHYRIAYFRSGSCAFEFRLEERIPKRGLLDHFARLGADRNDEAKEIKSAEQGGAGQPAAAAK